MVSLSRLELLFIISQKQMCMALSLGELYLRRKVTENLKEALRGDQEEETKSPAQNSCADSAWIRHFLAPASWV